MLRIFFGGLIWAYTHEKSEWKSFRCHCRFFVVFLRFPWNREKSVYFFSSFRWMNFSFSFITFPLPSLSLVLARILPAQLQFIFTRFIWKFTLPSEDGKDAESLDSRRRREFIVHNHRCWLHVVCRDPTSGMFDLRPGMKGKGFAIWFRWSSKLQLNIYWMALDAGHLELFTLPLYFFCFVLTNTEKKLNFIYCTSTERDKKLLDTSFHYHAISLPMHQRVNSNECELSKTSTTPASSSSIALFSLSFLLLYHSMR